MADGQKDFMKMPIQKKEELGETPEQQGANYSESGTEEENYGKQTNMDINRGDFDEEDSSSEEMRSPNYDPQAVQETGEEDSRRFPGGGKSRQDDAK